MWIAQLADFLRRRREALQPEDVGVDRGARRRTRGLRREEVATLASMSTDDYSRLEQQRGPQPSESMLASIARALRLTHDERDHLLRLAGHAAPLRASRSDHVNPALLHVLDGLDTPAQVNSDLGHTLVQNPLATALMGDQTRHAGLERSIFYRYFTDPEERRISPEEDHEHHARAFVAGLRSATARGHDPDADEMVAQLEQRSREFRQLWAEHQVALRHQRPQAHDPSTARRSSPRTVPRSCSSTPPLPARRTRKAQAARRRRLAAVRVDGGTERLESFDEPFGSAGSFDVG